LLTGADTIVALKAQNCGQPVKSAHPLQLPEGDERRCTVQESGAIPCVEFEQLRRQHEAARIRWTNLADESNLHPKVLSDRKHALQRKASMFDMVQLGNLMVAHQESCPVCRRHLSSI
jgi:hypothetical protein